MYSLHTHTHPLIYIHIRFDFEHILKKCSVWWHEKMFHSVIFGISWWQYFIYKIGSTGDRQASSEKKSQKHKHFENKLRNFLISIERTQWLRRANESSSNNNNNKRIDSIDTQWGTQLTKSVPLGAMNLFYWFCESRMRCWRHFLWSSVG